MSSPALCKVVVRQNTDLLLNQTEESTIRVDLPACKTDLVLYLLRLLPVLFARFFCSRCDLLLENLALRQQLAVLKQKNSQPRLALSDKLFWVMLRRLWPGWKQVLILVQPETVVRWHRALLSK